MDDSAVADGASRKRVSTACEACRSTKIKCQPSDQPGVCQKCLESKRECVSRTGPRIRRRRAQVIQDSLQPPPPAGPSTFSIDFAVPAQPEVDSNFESLRDTHAAVMGSLFPSEPGFDPAPAEGFPSPPASSTHSHSIQDLHAKPQFNLASAESLLSAFHPMLAHFPCIVLPRDVTVSHLAAARPFVLLAILASASGSRTLQGHSLYDEEFRKVLGLKFVAGGERSLELLQGLLIYCACYPAPWRELESEADAPRYPFHLRPKNKQASQYLRMAADLVHDLELDQDFRAGLPIPALELTDQQLDNIRSYLSFYYLASAFITSWKKYRGTNASFTPWTASCCDILEKHAQVEEDGVLVSMVRLTNTLSEAAQAFQVGRGQSEQQSRLVLMGLETQFRDIQERMSPQVADATSIKISTLFICFYLDGGALLKLPRSIHQQGGSQLAAAPKLCASVGVLNLFLDYVVGLSEDAFIAFTGVEWARIIMAVILATRLSFGPVPECPEWDTSWARSQLKTGEFLARMCHETDFTAASKKVDALSASRVVLRMVKGQHDRRLAQVEEQGEAPGRMSCPMLDGSLDQYFPLWDAGFGVGPTAQLPVEQVDAAAQPVFHDLWATMTMSWAGDDRELSEE